MAEHVALHVEPRRVRQPFDVPDRTYDQLMLADPRRGGRCGSSIASPRWADR